MTDKDKNLASKKSPNKVRFGDFAEAAVKKFKRPNETVLKIVEKSSDIVTEETKE